MKTIKVFSATAIALTCLAAAKPTTTTFSQTVTIERDGTVIAEGQAIDAALQDAVVDFLEDYLPGVTGDFEAGGGMIGVGDLPGDRRGTNDGTDIVIEAGTPFLEGIATIMHEMIHTSAPSDDGSVNACEHAAIYSIHFNYLLDLHDFSIWYESETGADIGTITCAELDRIRKAFEKYERLCLESQMSAGQPTTGSGAPSPGSNPADCGAQ